MQNNPLIITIIVGAIALVLGAIAGYVGAILENRLTKSLDDARGSTETSDPKPAALGELQEPALHLMDHDILRVSVNARLQLQLALDGTRLEPDGLTAEQRARLVNIIVQIRPWIDGKTVLSPVSASFMVPMSESNFPSFTGSGLAVAPADAAQSPSAAKKPLRVDARRGFRSLLESEVKKPEPLLKNDIVKQIDDVLQKNLDDSPLASKRIRLEEGSTGEVVVYVGAVRYAGIDAVPDEDIRTVIQQAIKEWNDK